MRAPRFLRLRRIWLSEQLHAVVWLGFSIALIALYVCMHVHYQSDYEDSISADLDQAVKLYTVQPNPRSKKLELTIGNTPYDADIVDPGPLGIGELAPVKGLLVDTKVALDIYNEKLESALTDTLSRFQASVAHPGHQVANLAAVAPKTYDKLVTDLENQPPQEVRYQLRIRSPAIRSIWEDPPNEAAARSLVQAIKGSVAEKVTLSLPPVAPAERSGLDDIDGVLTNPHLASVALDAGSEVCERLAGLGANLRRFFVDANTPSPGLWNDGSECDFVGVYIAPTGGDEPARGEDGDRAGKTDETARCASGMGCYHQRLKDIAIRGAGFFWTAGQYLWIELIALAILGVVIRRLMDFGIVYARRRVGPSLTEAWEPRESVRTLIYMVTVPVLAVAIIWIMTATDLVSADGILFGDWTAHSLMPLAFLLGLFPDLGYVVLTRLIEAIFRDLRGIRSRTSTGLRIGWSESGTTWRQQIA